MNTRQILPFLPRQPSLPNPSLMEPVRKDPGFPLAPAAVTSDAPKAAIALNTMAGVVEGEESTDPQQKWANLFPELVRAVANNLLRSDVTEYIRLRAVCKPWRAATAAGAGDPRLMELRFFPRNWELLNRRDVLDLGERARFMNVLTGASLKVQIPPQYGRIAAGFYGCLILEDKTTRRMRLLNPVTMAVADLPYDGVSTIQALMSYATTTPSSSQAALM